MPRRGRAAIDIQRTIAFVAGMTVAPRAAQPAFAHEAVEGAVRADAAIPLARPSLPALCAVTHTLTDGQPRGHFGISVITPINGSDNQFLQETVTLSP